MTRCFARDCANEATHLVDFTACGEGFLPMCGECKRIDDLLMRYLQRSPEIENSVHLEDAEKSGAPMTTGTTTTCVLCKAQWFATPRPPLDGMCATCRVRTVNALPVDGFLMPTLPSLPALPELPPEYNTRALDEAEALQHKVDGRRLTGTAPRYLDVMMGVVALAGPSLVITRSAERWIVVGPGGRWVANTAVELVEVVAVAAAGIELAEEAARHGN